MKNSHHFLFLSFSLLVLLVTIFLSLSFSSSPNSYYQTGSIGIPSSIEFDDTFANRLVSNDGVRTNVVDSLEEEGILHEDGSPVVAQDIQNGFVAWTGLLNKETRLVVKFTSSDKSIIDSVIPVLLSVSKKELALEYSYQEEDFPSYFYETDQVFYSVSSGPLFVFFFLALGVSFLGLAFFDFVSDPADLIYCDSYLGSWK